MTGRRGSSTQVLQFLLLSIAALLVSRSALAITPVTGYVVVQPIDVCLTTGWSNGTPFSCAPYNNLSSNPDPTKFTTTTPIGFVDTASNVNNTRAIWLQSGIDITFLPMQFYFNASTIGSNYLALNDLTCLSTSCSSKMFSTLTSGKTGKPLPPLSTNSTTINMFFVDTLSGDNTVAKPIFGFAWIGANGVAISSDTFFPQTNAFGVPLFPVHFDTLAHEIGHNFGLDHTTFGAGSLCSGVPSPGGCNLMDAGNVRVIPADTTCTTIASSSSTGGALFDLATGLCASIPKAPQADNLILGNGNNIQQTAANASVFVNPTPNVNAIAGGGDPTFTVSFPTKINGQPNGQVNEYIAALVLALPQGFAFSSPAFVFVSGVHPASVEFLNGNNGQGNSNCVKPISGGPSIQCLEIDFAPGTFTANTSITFSANIVVKSTGAPATLAQLTCPSTATEQCLDLSYVFSDLLATTSAFEVRDKTGDLTANSQFPDATVASTIVNPFDFPTLTPANFPNFTYNYPPACLTSPSPATCFVGLNGPALAAFCNSNPTSPACPSSAAGGQPTPITQHGGD